MSDNEGGEIVPYPPWNFSWVDPGKLAVMAQPRNEANMKWIEEEGIKHLITLSPERRPPVGLTPGVKWTEIAIDEFEPPNMKQMKEFIEICQRSQLQNEAVGVHCRMGRGRSGVMAAIYLVQFHDLAPERAIIDLRLMRPNSLETPEQERAVIYYHDCIRGVKGTF